jgi:acetyltransferase-like isoleucine patch superfamily enzyme
MAAFRALRMRFGLRAPTPLPDHVTVGRHSYGLTARNFMRATAKAPIRVGAFCSFAPEVLIFGQADHPTALPSTYPFRSRLFEPDGPNRDAVTRGPVEIGNDVWVGTRAMILSGVTIGNGAVIGAGAVIARDVPPYAIMVGNPARLVRYRFSPETVQALLEIAWWEWDDAKLARYEALLYGDVEAFIARARAER